MTTLPPELAAFAYLLDAQTPPVRDAFNYCLCLLMAQAGVMRLAEMIASDNGEICVFETTVGDHFSVVKSAISRSRSWR